MKTEMSIYGNVKTLAQLLFILYHLWLVIPRHLSTFNQVHCTNKIGIMNFISQTGYMYRLPHGQTNAPTYIFIVPLGPKLVLITS